MFSPGLALNPESPNNRCTIQSVDHKAGVRHAAIKQVLRAAHIQNHFEIEGCETGFVALVANVYDVNYRRGKLDFGLDDGTGRIRAYKWDVEGDDAEREIADYEAQHFSLVRAIGRISEFRGLLSIQLTEINFVKDPHEIFHHVLSVMVESLMLRRGPPVSSSSSRRNDSSMLKPPTMNPTITQSTSQALANEPSETLSMHSLRNNLPSVARPNDSEYLEQPFTHSSFPLRRTPSSSPDLDALPQADMLRAQHTSESTMQSSTAMQVDETPHRSQRIGNDTVSPGSNHEPTSSSSASRRRRQHSRPSLAPGRLLRSSNKQPTTSAAAVTRYQASPQFISPTNSPPHPTESHNNAPPQTPEELLLAPQPPIDHDPKTPAPKIRRKSVRIATRKRDPYHHLSSLQRDIILTIQNVLSTTRDNGVGASIQILVRTIAKRHPGLTEDEFQEAFIFLVDEGYICNTIDENHFTCTL